MKLSEKEINEMIQLIIDRPSGLVFSRTEPIHKEYLVNIL